MVFISCIGVTSLYILFHKFAVALPVLSAPRRPERWHDTVWNALRRRPMLLCLGNFETLWEDTSSREHIVAFLERMHAIEHIALVVTMRGTKRPGSKIPWSRTMLPLPPLSLPQAIELFEDVSGRPADAPLQKLVKTIACNPLAITLVATLTKYESAAELLRHWQRSGAEIVAVGAADRESILRAAISISVNSQRMRENPVAKDVLALLGLLPDGLSSPILSSRLGYVPDIDVRGALDILQHVALVHEEFSAHSIATYRLPPPIRRWTNTNLHVSQKLKEALYQTYITYLTVDMRNEKTANKSAPLAEVINCEELLLRAFRDEFKHPALLVAARLHCALSFAAGNLSAAVISEAVERASGSLKAASFSFRDGYLLVEKTHRRL